MLIRSVLSPIPIYQMSVNVLPKGVKRDLHGMFNRLECDHCTGLPRWCGNLGLRRHGQRFDSQMNL